MTTRIDAHHHVWDLAARDQPWITSDMTRIQRSFAVDDLAPEAAAAGVGATVVVQTVAAVAETEELLDLAARTPMIAGVVGWVDLASVAVADHLDALLARASSPWLVGIRSLVEAESDRTWLLRPSVLDGLRAVADRGLAFDLLIGADQLTVAAEAAAAVPGCRFVLDHLAKPAIAARAWEPWAVALADLASCPNVMAKVSGLVTEADWSTWTLEELRPYVDHALECFGAARVLFGSDWPVCTLAASYGRVVATAERLVGALGPAGVDAFFAGNATAVYRLGDRGPRR